MRSLAPTLALLVAAALLGCASPPAVPSARADAGVGAADAPTVQLPDLRDELLALEQADQEVREEIMAALRSGSPPDSATGRRLVARQDSVDAIHRARLKQIVGELGWPDARQVGREGVRAVFIIVQHSPEDLAFQKDFLAWLEPAYRAGELFPEAGQWVALLTDRIRVHEDRPQLYGTQVSIENGQVRVPPIEDEARVDERRAALGLPPLAEYLAQLRRIYGIPD